MSGMIISQTPFRISLVGGGTDLPLFYKSNQEGQVISTAIDKYFYVVVKKSYDDNIRISYTKQEVVKTVDEVKHDLVRMVLLETGIERGVEIVTFSDIPSKGSGLGSSSSVIIGLLNALYAYIGYQKSTKELAEIACKIELERLNKPIGKQDQYIVAYGGIKEIIFKADDTVNVFRHILTEETEDQLSKNLLLFYTNIPRSADSILASYPDNKEVIAHLLNIKSLVPLLSNEIAKNIDVMGEVLKESWIIKKKLSPETSNPELDKTYNIAINAGAYGGKLCGAGGGGYFLFYCPIANQPLLKEALAYLPELPFNFERYGSRITHNSLM